jgi:predicted transposase YbfD/YdcC
MKHILDSLILAIPDPRVPYLITYPLHEVLFQCVTAIISGAEGPSDIALFGEEKLDWLRKYYPFKNGTCAHDTILRILGLIPMDVFERVFTNWVNEMFHLPEHLQLAIDGKKIRSTALRAAQQLSKAEGGQFAQLIVNIFVESTGIVLAQRNVSESMSEQEGAKYLIDNLELEGHCISGDANFLSREIVEKIIEKKAHYLMTLKAKSPKVYQECSEAFESCESSDIEVHQTEEQGHGRLEKRTYEAINVALLPEYSREFYKGAQKLIRVKRERTVLRKPDKEKNIKTWFYITSLDEPVHSLGQRVRRHWSVENELHHVLDVQFKEDDIRAFSANLASNMSVIRKVSINIISKSARGKGVKRTRMRASFSDKSRDKLLKISMR